MRHCFLFLMFGIHSLLAKLDCYSISSTLLVSVGQATRSLLSMKRVKYSIMSSIFNYGLFEVFFTWLQIKATEYSSMATEYSSIATTTLMCMHT